MEDRSQLPPDLPIQLPPSPLGDKYNVILALPSRMRQALMAVFHTSSFGLLIKPPEEDCSRIGQTFSSHTGRTSGLPFCSVTSLSSHSIAYGFCSWSLASKKRPADPGKKIAKAAGLKFFSAFPPPLERFAFLDLASDHARSRLDDGGRLLTRRQISHATSLFRHSYFSSGFT